METADIMSSWVQKLDGGWKIWVASTYTLQAGRALAAPPAESMPPVPNTGVFRITCDTATMDAIEADPDYTIMEETRHPV